MSNTLHAFEFLESSPALDSSIIVLFGDEPFLKSHVSRHLIETALPDEDAEINLIKLEGKQAELREISDELNTISLFGSTNGRLVFVDDADGFVSDNRAHLEEMISKPMSQGRLVLSVGQWRSNTRLYKQLDKSGLQIDCRLPLKGKSKDLTKVARWASNWAKKNHNVKIKSVVIQYMMELTGAELGLVDQNLAKLALYFDPKTEITEKDIDEYVGGWQTKTIWQVIDSAINGQTGTALAQLDRLFLDGEVPMSLFGQIAWSLRRYAMAFEEAQRFRRRQKPMNVDQVITNAGFHFAPEKKKVVEQLKKVGRDRGLQYYRLLMECDLALKASHASPSRARIALEKLILGLVDSPVSKQRAAGTPS